MKELHRNYLQLNTAFVAVNKPVFRVKSRQITDKEKYINLTLTLKIWLIFMFMGVCGNSFAQTITWQNSSPQGNKLNDIFFIDTNTGWAVGDGGVILKTTNGGTNWSVSYHTTCIGLNKVFFVSNVIGWAVGNYGTIIKTADGGQTWVAQNSGIQTNLFGVQFTSNSNGLAVGDLGYVLRTTDGGANWALAATVDLSPVLYDLFSFSSGASWVVGSAGKIAKSTDGGSSWEVQPTATSATLKAVQFKTELIGWAMGNGGVILKSVDGGANWTSIGGLSNTYSITDFAFIDLSNGFALDLRGYIFKTADGGANWIPVLTGNLSTTFPIFGAVSMRTINDVIAVGNGGNIQKTSNAGANWASGTSGITNDNKSIFFIDNNNGWAVNRGTTNEKVLKTNNGGSTWTAKLSNANLQLNKVFFADSNTGWVVGDNGATTGKVFKTTDAGENWTEQTLTGITVTTLNDVYFANTSKGLAVGTNGKIFLTNNGGTNWDAQASGITDNILSVFFLDVNTAYCTTANGKILKSGNGGVSWSQQTSGFTSNIRDIFFLDTNNGYAVADNANILKTTTGGTSWTAQNLGLSTIGGTITLLSIRFFDTNNGIALGFDALRGIYFTTINGGTTWTPNYLPILGGTPSSSFIKDYFSLGQTAFFAVGNFGSILKYGASNCPSVLTPTGTIANNQKAATTVISTQGTSQAGTENIIPRSANVIYQAGNYVQLNAGFQAVDGAVFTARILSACQ